jgi:hypothetical protein
MRNYSADPNSPDCPTNAAFKSTHVYEFHIVNGGGGPVQKPTQTKAQWVQSPQPNMGYAEMEVSVTLAETQIPRSRIPSTINQASLKLTFKGKARSKELMTKTFFDGQAQFKQLSFQSDIKSWLGQFSVSTSSIDAEANTVTATLTSPPMDGQSSSVSVNGKGEMTASSTSTIDGATAQVSVSTDQPFTIVFTFSPRPVKGEYKQTDFEGELEVELSVTYNPSAFGDADQAQSQAAQSAVASGESVGSASQKPGAFENYVLNKMVGGASVIAAGGLIIMFREAIADTIVVTGDVIFSLAAAWAAP